ncbi:MAG: metallophosphoesterase [Clostridia bacterium]|nr:metallophosphoesterase [Clostridia bacterium]
MDTVIQKVSFPKNKRIFVLSDPHAHMEGLIRILEKARFQKEDILVIVGDILEKGTENLKMVRYIMSLSQTHTVYTLMGNVDYWRLLGILSDDSAVQKDLLSTSIAYGNWWKSSLLEEMLSEIGVPMTEETDTMTVFPLLRTHFKKELDFLSSLPAILETQNYIFVHGGIPHENLSELKHQQRHPFLKWDHFLTADVSFQKTVIVGHWPVTLYSKSYPNAAPVYDRNKNVLSIDGGCGVKKEGQINLLVFPTYASKKYDLFTWDGLPTVKALGSQTESSDFSYIRWGDDEVIIVKQDEETADVLHHGRKMTIPAKNLFKKGNAWHASEYTDYLLPVSPGDALSVILETPNGVYAKKNSVTGWYMGRYEKL